VKTGLASATALLFHSGQEDERDQIPMCDTVAHNPEPPGRSTAKDARAARSGAALRTAMLRLLERKSLEQITVRDICAEAGVHYATFFRHHAGKEALLEEIAADQIATLVDLTLPIKETTGDRMAFGALCDYVEKHCALWAILLNGGAGAAMRQEWLRRAQTVAEQTDSVGSWLPKELGTICSTSLIADTISWWLAQPTGSYSASQVAQILDRLVTSSTLAKD
jgi:AcrR family transcriptional regulator